MLCARRKPRRTWAELLARERSASGLPAEWRRSDNPSAPEISVNDQQKYSQQLFWKRMGVNLRSPSPRLDVGSRSASAGSARWTTVAIHTCSGACETAAARQTVGGFSNERRDWTGC